MARVTFAFGGRPSPARGWDIRFRVAAVVALGLGTLNAGPAGLGLLTGVLALLLALARTRWGEVVRILGGFLPFLLFFFVLGWAFEPTAAQAAFLGLQSWRLALLLVSGHFLFLTATPGDVTEGLRWYLGWLGSRRAWAAASMASWALASVPEVLDQAAGLGEAAALRGLEARRRPVRTLGLLTLGLLVRTFSRSSDLADALAARGFGDAVPPLALRARWSDAAGLGAVVLAAVGAILAP
jgi:energy-coupling factor transporter transmembrane protein EcfT